MTPPPPRKVLYVVDDLPLPSQTFVVDEMAERMRQGDQIRVLTLREHAGAERWSTVPTVWGGSSRSLVRAAVPVALRRPVAMVRGRNLARAATLDERPLVPWRSLTGRANQLRNVEFVHAHFGWSSAVRAEVIAGLLGAPWGVTFHGHDVYGQDRDLARKMDAADLPVTVCEAFADHLSSLGGRRPSVVWCGVTPPSPDWQKPTAEVDVVAVGRLVEKKGFDVLIHALARLPSATAWIVGEGPLRGRLEALAQQLGIDARVIFLGEQPHAQVLARLARARVCAVPARVAADGDRDSMPLVVKEAMVRLVPVVASMVGGLPELVTEGTGWPVPPDDMSALAAAIARVLAGGPAVDKRASAARRAVSEHALPLTVARLRALTEAVLTS